MARAVDVGGVKRDAGSGTAVVCGRRVMLCCMLCTVIQVGSKEKLRMER